MLEAVSGSYDHFETDRRLIERSMDISSEELVAINQRLQREAQNQRTLLDKLYESLTALNLSVQRSDASVEDELVRIADLLREQIKRRRAVERQLLESEERFRLIAENASDIIVRYDENGICRYVSPSSYPLLGYTPEELLGKKVFSLMHPDDVERVRALLGTYLPREERFVIDARIRRKDGLYRWFETSANTIRHSETNTVLEIHTAARDVTDRKVAENKLLTISSRLSALIESLEGGVLVEDEKRHIAVVNQHFCDMFGIPVSPSVLLDTDCSKSAEESKNLFADSEEFVRRIDEILEHRRIVTDDELPLADGRVFERDYIPIYIDGVYNGHLWHYRDITERKKAEHSIRRLNDELTDANELLTVEMSREKEHVRALQELNSMKNEFVSGVSHELRTPLASIIGFAQTLLLDPDLPLEIRTEFIQIIHDEGKRLAKLINDLLDIARIESGRIGLEKQETDLVPLLERAMQSVAMQADAKDIELTTEFGSKEMVGMFDPDRITQVVVNLLGNAVKFTPRNGKVALRCDITDDTLTISVSDTGLGIPESDIPHLFEKFYRVHRPGLDIRGTGLGLAIVGQLVEMHNGSIEIESTVNEGSTFTVRLPKG